MTTTTKALPLTERQREVLQYLYECLTLHQHVPTYRQMCTHFEWASPHAPESHLLALQSKGYIRLHKAGQGRRCWRLAEVLGVRTTIEDNEAGRRLREALGISGGVE